MNRSVRRIMMDCKEIMTDQIDNIYYHHDEDNLYKGYALIIGPKDTPYENGFYFFQGRADDMFVSSGNNIYPRQIESVLEDHPQVKISAVVGLEDDIKGMKPYAFAIADADETELKSHVLKFLPPGHCPRKIWIIDQMPLNSVNKIDKNQLKLWAQQRNDIA